jgi:uroporphyrinogen-III decarboxylase
MLHMCGRTNHLLEVFSDDLRIGEFQAFGYEVDLDRVVSVMGGQVVLLGNVSPLLIRQGPPHRVREAVRSCIEKLAPHRGYIVQDGANIPPGTPVEHINAMMEEAERSGVYR